jgi:type II secretory pathway pseudopilin PulG
MLAMQGRIDGRNRDSLDNVSRRGRGCQMTAEKGFTLVEVMIAFLVLLITSLALMQTALVSIEANMKNVLRDEAVRIADSMISDAMAAPFDTVATYSGAQVKRTLKNVDVQFTTGMTVSNPSTDIKQLDVTVQWTWKGITYTHATSTIMRRT